MLMPSKYENAIKQETFKRIIHFLKHGEYKAKLSDDYEIFELSTSLADSIMTTIEYVDYDKYTDNMENTYVFNEPGEYDIIFTENIFEVTKIS